MPRPESPGFAERLAQSSDARADMFRRAGFGLGKQREAGTTAEPPLSGNGAKTASLLLAAGLTVASFGSAACTPGGATEAQPPGRILPTSGAATVTPWRPDALPPGIPTPIPRNTPIPTSTQSPDLVKNCPVCSPGQVWAAPGKYCQDIKKSDVTENPAFVDCSPSSNSCFPGYGCNPPEQRNVAPSLAQPKPPEAPKPAAAEGKISISKKPEEMLKILLTTPFQSDELPPGLIAIENKVSEPIATARALKAIAQIDIMLADKPEGFFIGAFISYHVFPNASVAEANFAAYKTDGSRPVPEFANFGLQAIVNHRTNTCILPVDYVLVQAQYVYMDVRATQATREARAISLAEAAVNHLQRVGR